MSDDAIKTPRLRRLLLVGVAFVAVGGFVLASGMKSRADDRQQLVQWTNDQAIPSVALAKIVGDSPEQTVVLPGTIQPFSKALINARVSGYLNSWQSDIGTHVRAGQMLATIETPDLDQQLDQAKADLATATANEQLASLTAKRWHALVGSQAVAQQTADEKTSDAQAKNAVVQAAQANVRRLQAMENFKTLVAPFDGIITARNTDIGALINAGSSAGQDLFEVSDLHKVRVYVQVPQSYSARLTPGLKAVFDVPQYPGQQFNATLVSTSQAMNMNSRSMLVELLADNADGKLASGTYAQVYIQVPGDPNTLRVPATALVVGSQNIQVAVLGADNKVALKTVQIGRDLGDSVEVVAGLSPSDRVIDSPPETLQNGDQVRLAETSSPDAKLAALAPASK
jgi:membrane fusion protein, multidrug efflux system